MDRKALIITVSILIGLDSSIIIDHLGIHIPLAREVFGFIALTFLPGYLLLKILRTRVESISESIFMTVALSISTVMFMGIFANFIYPFIGIKRPITLKPLLVTFNVIVVSLLVIQQNRSLETQENLSKFPKITRWDLFFLLLPLFSLLSAYMFSFYGDNRGLLALYFVISLTPIIFIKVKNFNRAFAIWSIAISLMWSTVFGVSWNYIWGYDISGEYYYAHLVLRQGMWNVSTYYQYNTVASVNILAPLYSLILNIGIIPIFKIIYPLIFSMVPVILLKAYERLLGKRIWAELSILFFMFLFTFFTEMMALARQMIAELYLALMVYALIKRVHPLLLLIFGTSLIVSHYGTAYMVMFALLFVIPVSLAKKNSIIKESYVVLFWLFTLLWYQYVGGGFEFHKLVDIGYFTVIMLKNILKPQYSQGLAIIASKTTLTREIAKWINLIAQGLISIGMVAVVYTLIKQKERKYIEFYVLSFVFFAYDVAGVIVPFFANRLNATRLYQITLFFLSPYPVIGTATILKGFRKLFRVKLDHVNIRRMTKALAGFLLVYFLFNSGFMLEVTKDPQPVLWLDKYHSPSWSPAEITGARWLKYYTPEGNAVWLGNFKFPLFLGLGMKTKSFGKEPQVSIYAHNGNQYVYLGKETVLFKEIEAFYFDIGGIQRHQFVPLKQTKLWKQLYDFNKIYSSNQVWEYYVYR